MRFMRVEVGRSQLKSPQIPAADEPTPESIKIFETGLDINDCNPCTCTHF
jgi:hypothetical protein